MFMYEEQNSLLRVVECGAFNFQPHFHPHLEICQVLDGQAGVQIDNKQYTLEEGDISFSFPNVIHGLFVPDAKSRSDLKLIIISPELCGAYRNILYKTIPVDPIIRAKNVSPDILTAVNGIVRAAHMTNQMQSQDFITGLTKDTDAVLFNNERLRGDCEAASCYFVLLMMLAMRTLPCKANQSDMNSDLAHRLIVYLQTHYMEELSLDSIAKALYVSKGQISRVMSAQLHTSLPTYMNQLRLDHSMDMLRTTELMISEIAERCGFNSERTFHRTFRARFNTEPRKVRQRQMTQKNALIPSDSEGK